jgi:glutaredoxin
MNNYIIYTRPDCGYCDRAKALIEQKGGGYQELTESVKQMLLKG